MAASLEWALLATAIILLLSALASKASSRLGIPSLLFFIAIGILAGSEGIGGIYFDDPVFARSFGTVALALIVFAGGLDTRWSAVSAIWRHALSLSVLGTALTAALVGLFAHLVLGWRLLEGMLLGAIVSSTDAAAVFGVLRARSLNLKHRLGPLLELESGTNDPTAVFLVLAITGALTGGSALSLGTVGAFAVEMVVGALAGVALGLFGSWMINRIRLDFDGLYAAVTLGIALLAYGGTTLVGGNGFLGAYIAGLTLGSRNFLRRITLTQFHDGVAWLMQIGMFLVLGLLVFPSQLTPVMGAGIVVSAFLIAVSRPVAVFLALAASRKFAVRDRLFLSWAGLRGAVPIILATIPLTEGVARSQELFNLVFFVVLLSVALQGSSLGWVAKKLGVLSERDEAATAPEGNVFEVEIVAGSLAAGRQVVELSLPTTALLLLHRRGKKESLPKGSTHLLPGDKLMLATRKDDVEELRGVFERVRGWSGRRDSNSQP